MEYPTYHEKQEGRQCGKHALNNLFQQRIFTTRRMKAIAAEVDTEEKAILQEHFTTANCTAYGDYTYQVMEKAVHLVKNQGKRRDLLNIQSMDHRAAAIRESTKNAKAFLCNRNDHWFAIRRFNDTWFSLDSCLAEPRQLDVIGEHVSIFASEKLIEEYKGIYIVL